VAPPCRTQFNSPRACVTPPHAFLNATGLFCAQWSFFRWQCRHPASRIPFFFKQLQSMWFPMTGPLFLTDQMSPAIAGTLPKTPQLRPKNPKPPDKPYSFFCIAVLVFKSPGQLPPPGFISSFPPRTHLVGGGSFGTPVTRPCPTNSRPFFVFSR